MIFDCQILDFVYWNGLSSAIPQMRKPNAVLLKFAKSHAVVMQTRWKAFRFGIRLVLHSSATKSSILEKYQGRSCTYSQQLNYTSRTHHQDIEYDFWPQLRHAEVFYHYCCWLRVDSMWVHEQPLTSRPIVNKHEHIQWRLLEKFNGSWQLKGTSSNASGERLSVSI